MLRRHKDKKKHEVMDKNTKEYQEWLAQQIVDIAYHLHVAQLLSYLRLTNKSLGFIINFTVPLIKDGIKRRVL